MTKAQNSLTMTKTKRIFDIILALALVALLSIPLLVVALLIKLNSKGPVLFRQERPGKDGKIFVINKFRTMTYEYDKCGNLLPDVKRLKPFGSFLRRMSIDELPELLNVIKGEMSLVGPRPLLMQYLDLYTPEQARRHEVKPGITGWAQINGRNAISWEDKFLLDIWYVDNLSLWLDIKIIILTVCKVFIKEGINQPGHATAEKFKGAEKR